MKKLSIILLLICCLILTGCSKDEQVDAFIKEYSSVTAEVAAKLDEGKTDEARQVFESRKASLIANWDAIRTGLPFQYTEETKKRMKTEPERAMTVLTEAANKAIKKNPNSEAKVQAVVLELANVFRK